MKLLTTKYKFLVILLFGALSQVSGQTTFADNFTTQAYNRNDGIGGIWSTNWIETNDDGSPSFGDTFIFLGLGNVLAFVGDGANNNGGHGINRTVDLSGASIATLSFDWRTQGLDTFAGDQEELGIFMSNDNGTNFTQIGSGTIIGNNIGSFSQDISAFISANTVFRLQAIGGNEEFEAGEFAFIDNLEISAVFGPLISVIDQTINENVGTATITVQLTGGTVSGGFSVDYNTVDNTAIADSDFITSSGALNFIGNLNETQTFTIPIINNVFGENDETFFINLSNVSNPSVSTSNGTITINDDGDPALSDDVPLTLFDQFNGYYDYALTAGTLRTEDETGDPCAITISSSNTLTTTIPAGSTIEKAYLIWGHSKTAADDVVTFEGQAVTADIVNTAFGIYHGMVSDVTSIIQSVPDPSTNTYDFSGLSIDTTDDIFGYCSGTAVFGGWALYIFYTNPTLPAVSINMYNGFDGQVNTATSYSLNGFFAIGSAGSKTSVLSWEGDPQRDGNEVISITTTTGTTTLTGDGNNLPPLESVFNSTIYDDTAVTIINDSSLFGFDLDTYDISSLITQGETSATTNIETGGDFVILNSVLLKVPSNLITGRVFEDINYGGGPGRDLAISGGVGLANVRVELYNSSGTLEDFDITDANGDYNIGGMANGTYSLRVVNNTIRSNRDAVPLCGSCIPVQTYKTEYIASTITPDVNEVGGANPSAVDVAAGILTGAQSVSAITILNEGVVGVDFGFTYNAIVNTNPRGQGSLAQFITNANQFDSIIGLDIEANSIFDPAPGEEVSIFMIPPATDPLGRIADLNYNANGYFDIDIPDTIGGVPYDLPEIFGSNIHIDGRTQTAYSDTNVGVIGAGGTSVGTTGTVLPIYNLPEIQIHQNNGNTIRSSGDGAVIRNLAIYADDNAGIFSITGDLTIRDNLIGVNAEGVNAGNIDRGIFLRGTVNADVDGNYIATNTDRGIYIFQTTTTLIQNNHITNNGVSGCQDNIKIFDGSTVTIQNNLIENAAAVGIDANGVSGNVTITGNTIRESGQNGGACGAIVENAGIILFGSNSTITNNIINNNGGAGIVLGGGTTSGNLISQNSIYANGTSAPSLGIDLDPIFGTVDGDGVTRNDSGDGDTGPNGRLNFPIFETATIKGNILKVTGWARPGATLEFFLTDINQGTASVGDNQLGLTQDYGEGQIFLASAIEGGVDDTDGNSSSYTDADGNTDTTNRFNFTIPLSTKIPILGNSITATATIANSTSEFANTFPLAAPNVITNRRITYRVKPKVINIGVTGTLTPEITADNFQDGNNGAPFSIILRNTTTNVIIGYEVLIQSVPYASIPGISLGNHTLNTIDNGDGTYNHIFTSTAALNGSESRIISGSLPSPIGIGIACGCISFYKL